MPSSSILFNPELDERQLDKEVGQIDDQLSEVGQNVPVNFDDDMDGLSPAGGGRGGGFGGAAAGAGLASRIPKPVSGVTAASALPIAIAGGVGLGLLSAMQNSSARLQTSTTLLGQAWNNVWAPIGNRVDELFIRDTVLDIHSATADFRTKWEQGQRWEALIDLGQDLAGEAFDFAVNLSPALAPNIVLGAQFLSGLDMPDAPAGFWPTPPKFPDEFLPSAPEFPDTFLPDAPEFPSNFWPDVQLAEWVKQITDPTGTDDSSSGGSASNRGGRGSKRRSSDPNDRGRRGSNRGNPTNPPGSSTRTGSARPASGRGAGTVSATGNTRGVEDKLDEVNRNLKRAMDKDVVVQVGEEEIARATSGGLRNRVSDTNPMI